MPDPIEPEPLQRVLPDLAAETRALLDAERERVAFYIRAELLRRRRGGF